MDPLSILASVAGLLMAAGTVTTTLINMSVNIKDAPRLVAQVLSEVNDVKIALSAMQKFLLGLASAPRKRTALIQLDQLLATLTEAVLTFSELESMIAPFNVVSKSSMAQRVIWHWKEDTASSIMERLHRHKSSLSLMLNILQCQSDLEAEQSRETLQNLVEQLLESNKDISRRLYNLEASCDSQSILTRCFRNGISTETIEEENEDTKTITSHRRVSNKSDRENFNFQVTAYQFAFENDLETSRVYKRTRIYEPDVSFTSSGIRTHAWSIFSGLSLAEISIISAIALPINSHDISNSLWYNFEEPPQNVSQHAAPIHVEPPTLSTTAAVNDQVGTGDQVKWTLSPPTLDKYPGLIKFPAVEKPSITMKLYKLVTLGDDGVGKTDLTIQLYLNHFVETYDATIEDSYRKQVVIDGESCMLEVLDTAGQEEYTALRDQWIRDGEGFVIVYSITSRSSFNRSRKFHNQIQRVKESSSILETGGYNISRKPEYIPVMLVGNNCERVTEREVSAEEGHKLARELDCEFIETSARNCINVEKAFYDVVRQIRLHQSLPQQSTSRPAAKQRYGGRQQRLTPAWPARNGSGLTQRWRRDGSQAK